MVLLSVAVATAVMSVVIAVAIAIRQEVLALIGRLLVVVLLVEGQRGERVQHVNHAGHVLVDQTDQFVVALLGNCTLNCCPFTNGGVVTHVVPSKLAGFDENPGHPPGKAAAPERLAGM